MNHKYGNPEILKLLDQIIFELNSAQRVEGSMPGRHKSVLIGKSLEFVQHRDYVPGDDLRYIDWKVYGRRDKFFIKQYHQETNLICNIMLDCSGSMWYPKNNSKYEYGSAIASYISYILLNQNDAVGVIKFDKNILSQTECKPGRGHYHRILEFLEDEYLGSKSDFINCLNTVQKQLKKNSLLIIISDLISEEQKLIKVIKEIVYSGINIIITHIIEPTELTLKFELENVTFEDVEGIISPIKTNIIEIKSLYIKEVNKILELYRKELNGKNINYLLIDISKPIIENLKLIISTE